MSVQTGGRSAADTLGRPSAGRGLLEPAPAGPRRATRRELPRNLPSLTGMRVLAALAVFATHSRYAFPRNSHWHLVNTLGVNGRVGVSFFFVLSGFVLAWSGGASGGTARYLWRRVARIYPAYVTALIVCGLIEAHMGFTSSLRGWLAAIFLVQAWSPHSSIYYAVNGVSWSLSCEAFFYLTLPLVLPLLRRLGVRGRRRLGFALLGIITLIGVLGWNSGGNSMMFWFGYIFPPVRWLEFLLGVLLALELRAGTLPQIPRISAFSAVAVTYLGVTRLNPDDTGHLLPATVTLMVPAFLVAVAAWAWHDAQHGPGVVMRSSQAQIWGKRSYSFYLLHATLLNFTYLLVNGTTHRQDPQAVLVAFVAALVAAALLHDLLESPAERWLRKLTLRDLARPLRRSGRV